MRRRETLALLVSLALHGVALFGLRDLWPDTEPGFAADTLLVRASITAGEQPEVAEPAQGADDAVPDAPEPSPGEETVASTQSVPADSGAESVPPAPPPEPAIETTSPVETPAAAAAEDPAESAAETVADNAPATESSSPVEATPALPQEPIPADSPGAGDGGLADTVAVASDTGDQIPQGDAATDMPRLPAEPAQQRPQPVGAVAAAAGQAIEYEVRRWSRGFVALADWQPDTSWEHDGVRYAASVARIPAADSMGVEEAVVRITMNTDAGDPAFTEVRMQRLGFSHYAQFVDYWDRAVQIHDDEIDGRFHSNSEIFVSSSRGIQPRFLGKVTTAEDVNTSMSDRRVRRDDVFLGGLETRSGRIVLPRDFASMLPDVTAAANTVVTVARTSSIEFTADGAALITPLDGGPARTVMLGGQPKYIVGEDRADIHVEGVVNGQVLVYAPGDIVITGNLVYADAPGPGSESDDYLGLVAQKSVEIAPVDVTGPGMVTVHAAIYALGRFAVRDYIRRGGNDDTLEVIGSIAARSVTATEPRFKTRLVFDRRFENTRPPGFPVTDRYEILNWDRQWYAAGETDPQTQ